MIGLRIGPAVGLRVGLAVGLGDDPIAPASGIPGVSRDAASGWYFPANATEWTTFMSAISLSTGNPMAGYGCQEASGNLADNIDTATLTLSGAGHLFQQSVAGFTRKAVATVDGTAGQKWITTTTAPNPSLTSTLWLSVLRMPAANPAAARDLMASQAALDHRISTTSKQTVINGASTAGTATLSGTVQLIAMQHNITGSSFTGFNLSEKIAGTFGAAASNTTFALGGQTTSAGDIGYLAHWTFQGAAAELTSAQMKTLFQGLTGLVIPWS